MKLGEHIVIATFMLVLLVAVLFAAQTEKRHDPHPTTTAPIGAIEGETP